MRKPMLVFWLAVVCLVPFSQVQGQIFDFNVGDNQEWTYTIYTDLGRELVSISPTGWMDVNNYPAPPRSDPVGDGRGSATVGVNAMSLGSLFGDEAFYVLYFLSQDLGDDPQWQGIDSFSAQVLPSFDAPGMTYYASLRIYVFDEDQSRERYFQTEPEELTLDDWIAYVGELAAMAPARFSLPADGAIELLAEAT